jgi:hypothetical protein
VAAAKVRRLRLHDARHLDASSGCAYCGDFGLVGPCERCIHDAHICPLAGRRAGRGGPQAAVSDTTVTSSMASDTLQVPPAQHFRGGAEGTRTPDPHTASEGEPWGAAGTPGRRRASAAPDWAPLASVGTSLGARLGAAGSVARNAPRQRSGQTLPVRRITRTSRVGARGSTGTSEHTFKVPNLRKHSEGHTTIDVTRRLVAKQPDRDCPTGSARDRCGREWRFRGVARGSHCGTAERR